MFVMTDDGGRFGLEGNDLTAERTLSQRVFIFDLLNHGLAVTPLNRCEFRDSKVS